MKKTKQEVHYSMGTPQEHCGICRHFRLGFTRTDGCTKVAGVIKRGDWCTLWVKRPLQVSRKGHTIR